MWAAVTHGVRRGLSGLLITSFCGLSVGYSAWAQEATILGRVVDAETGESVAGVNVFLDKTTYGAATTRDGNYEIVGLHPGSYRVVASMIGYGVESTMVDITPDHDVYEIDFSIQKSVIQVGEIEVVAEKDRTWQRSLERFTREYLGQSPNAKETVILNPFVLDFKAQHSNFEVYASAPLDIENRALGYRLRIDLTYYRDTGRIVSTGGPVFFRKLVPADKKEELKWRRNRQETYSGSFMHLMRSLVQGNSRQQGFVVVHEIPPSDYVRRRRRLDLGLIPFIFPGEQPYLYRLEFEHELYVEYGRETSWLWLDENEAILHADGYLVTSEYEEPPMRVRGDMALKRVADLLPRDYRPR